MTIFPLNFINFALKKSIAMLKRILIAFFAVAMAFSASAQLIAGEKSLGPKLGYVSENKSAVVGLVFQYNINERFRLSPEIGAAFRNHDRDAFLIDLNLHAPFFFDNDKVDLYPLAGLAFNSWATHNLKDLDNNDVTSHKNRFGANLGAGFDLRCSSTLKLNLEAKYTFIKGYSAFYLTAGISYLF